MLALRVRALAVRARAVRLCAGRVLCLCSVRLDRADFARRRRRHLFSRLPPITLLLLAPHVHTMLYSGSHMHPNVPAFDKHCPRGSI